MPPPPLSRRAFCALSSGLLVPLRALAAASDRTFLFVYCEGGWDQAHVFAPIFGSDAVDMEPEAVAAEVGGIPFVDAGDRPAVRAFFERWAHRTCLVNGVEVPGVSHDRCRRLVFTGANAGEADDWATALAGATGAGLPLPHVVLSGPAYSHRYTDRVVRVGAKGQLPALLDGSALAWSDLPVQPPAQRASDLVAGRLRDRLAALAPATAGQEQALLQGYSRALDELDLAAEHAALLSAGAGEPDELGTSLYAELSLALSAFELGLSRAATVRYQGVWNTGWDNHADIAYQALHFQELFTVLDVLMDELDHRAGPGGRPLAETVTVVVFSEMGRDPRINEWGGRHHWTTTSAMLLGAGVQGGRALGGWDAHSRGLPVDLATGEPADGGTPLDVGHLGATVLALGGVDPAEWTASPPIGGVMA